MRPAAFSVSALVLPPRGRTTLPLPPAGLAFGISRLSSPTRRDARNLISAAHVSNSWSCDCLAFAAFLCRAGRYCPERLDGVRRDSEASSSSIVAMSSPQPRNAARCVARSKRSNRSRSGSRVHSRMRRSKAESDGPFCSARAAPPTANAVSALASRNCSGRSTTRTLPGDLHS